MKTAVPGDTVRAVLVDVGQEDVDRQELGRDASAEESPPFFQVVITRKMRERRRRSGNQPPLKNFSALAAKKGRSKLRNSRTSGSARQRGHFHVRVRTTK